MTTNNDGKSWLVREEAEKFLRYDPETGNFYWLGNRRGGVRAGDIAGSKNTHGYIVIVHKMKTYLAHRLAFVFMQGKYPDKHVDHIDGNKTNNKWANLRLATNAENMQNRLANSNSLTKKVGVSKYGSSCRAKKQWRAKIVVNGKPIHLGSFYSEDEAAQAYAEAKKKYHTFNPGVRSTT